MSADEEKGNEAQNALGDLPGRLQRARKRRNKTQAQIAARAGLSTVTLSKIEIGKNVPSLETLMALAHALDLSPNDLLGWEQSDGTPSPRQKLMDQMVSLCEQLPDDWLKTLIDVAIKASKP